jgi:hypothetical protein
MYSLGIDCPALVSWINVLLGSMFRYDVFLPKIYDRFCLFFTLERCVLDSSSQPPEHCHLKLRCFDSSRFFMGF